jgi:hypothetical protein
MLAHKLQKLWYSLAEHAVYLIFFKCSADYKHHDRDAILDKWLTWYKASCQETFFPKMYKIVHKY